jgi:hypothetical protein
MNDLTRISSATITQVSYCEDRLASPALACPRFEDWLSERPDLWSAGGSVQRELFFATMRGTAFAEGRQE